MLMKVFVPAAPSGIEAQSLRRSLDSMAGKVIGIIDNSMPNVHEMADDIDELLVGKYGVAKVVKYRKEPAGATPDAVMKELTDQCDAIIVGMGQ
jgi:hypothetical protein